MKNHKSMSPRGIKTSLLLLMSVCLSTLLFSQAPSNLSYPNPNVFVAQQSGVYLAPTVAGIVTSYSVSPALPAGLTLNTNTGVITGIPSTGSNTAIYTVTATGGSPSGSTSFPLSIQVTSNYFNNNYANVNFGGPGVTITRKTGDSSTTGNIVLYQNVATLSGQSIDCIVTMVQYVNATVTRYDHPDSTGTNFTGNTGRFFSPQFTFANGGSVLYDFKFIYGGSYNNTTNTGSPVILQNLQINTYDIDGNGQANSNQYNEFGGFDTSELGSASTVVPTLNSSTGLTKFRSNTTANSTNTTADPTRVRVTFKNLSDFQIRVGSDGTGASFFFLEFGSGPAFSTAQATPSPSLDLNNSTAGSSNTATGCGALAFTDGSGQTNVGSGAPYTSLSISFPTADVVNGASETLVFAGAANGTIPLNFANGASIPNPTFATYNYNVAATVANGISTLTFTNNSILAFNNAAMEQLLDALSYNNSSATPTNGSRRFTLSIQNGTFQSPSVAFTAVVQCVSLSGNVFHDANGYSDALVNATGSTPTTANQVYVVRVNPANNQVISSTGVAAGGAYNFGFVTPGTYNLFIRATQPANGATITAASFPAGYVATAENLSALTGNDNLTDGKLTVTVGSTSVSAGNFSIEQPPVTADNTLTNQVNPGSRNNYTIPNGSFSATDADGSISYITITSFPTNANYLKVGNTYYTNPTGGICPPQVTCTTWPGTLQIPYTSGNPSQPVSIDPNTGALNVAITFNATDNAGISSIGSNTLNIPFVTTGQYSITGSIWQDVNGNGIKEAAENYTAAAAAGDTLYAVLVQTTNTYSGAPTVYLTQTITAASPGYTFANVTGGSNFELRIVSAVTPPVAGSLASAYTPKLATGYTAVSTTNGATVVTGLNTNAPAVAITNLSANLTGVSIGIEQSPISGTSSLGNQPNPGGFNNYTLPTGSFVASDPDGAITNITITAFPTGANYLKVGSTYYTNGGSCPPGISCTAWPGTLSIPYTSGNPSQTISVDPTAAGAGSVAISYTATDNGGVTVGPSTLTIPFVATSQYSIGGNVWADVNGNGVKDAAEVFTAAASSGQTLYAVLVQTTNTFSGAPTVFASAAVSATTGYSFTGVPGGSDYQVRLVSAATPPAAGSAASAITPNLATGYVDVSTTNGATVVTGLNTNNPIINAAALAGNLANVSFGIEQAPTAGTGSLGSQNNPGGFNAYTIPNGSFGAADADGSIASITITAFPTGANYLKVGTTIYTNPSGGVCPPQATCTAWPGTLVVPYTSGNPTQAISVDPTAAGATSVAITYTATDNAGATTGAAGTLTISFVATAQYTVGGNVWADVNGNGVKDAAEVFTAAASTGQTLYAVIVQTTNNYSGVPTVFASTAVSATTGYSFAGVPGGNDYEVRLVSAASAPAAGSAASAITPNLATGYTAVSTVNGATVVTGLNTNNPIIAIANLSSALPTVSFGIEQVPAATSNSLSNQANPGGFNAYTIPNGTFNITDPDGTISGIILTSFPSGANYLRVGNTYYTNPSGGSCPPQVTCTTWPGALIIPFTGGNPTEAISVDPTSGSATSVVLNFVARDNAGGTGPASSLTIPFTSSTQVSITGNVWQDVNGNAVKDASEVFTAAANSGETLVAVLVQNTNTYSGVPTVLSTGIVDASTGAYVFAGIPAGNNYEVRLLSTVFSPAGGAAASTITPKLAAGYTAVSTTNGASTTTGLNTNNPIISFTNMTAAATNVSFGIEMVAVADAKSYTAVNGGSSGPLTTVSIVSTSNSATTYVRQLNMTGTASTGSIPGIITGTDPDGGANNSALVIGSGPSSAKVVINPSMYSNTGSSSAQPTMVSYNGVQLTAGGCQGSNVGSPSCSFYNAVSGFWEIPNYDASLLKVLVTPGTTAAGFMFAIRDAAGALGSFSAYNVSFDRALPLTLVSFTAKSDGGNGAILDWKTSNEVNTDRFDIERSTDGISFFKAGSVKASGQSQSYSYSFTDANLAAGNNYYRLVMYDLDGSYKYSETKLVTVTTASSRLSVYPNPVRGIATVKVSWQQAAGKNGSLTIYERTGRQVFTGKLDALGNTSVKINNWVPGVYYIMVDNGQRKEFSKLVVE